MLVGHVPIEFSCLLFHFLGGEETKCFVSVREKRKREIGLVVPGKYTALTKNKRYADILHQQLKQKEQQQPIEFKLYELRHEIYEYD